MFTLLAKILSALNSDAEPHQIASGVALAMLAGLNPLLGGVGLLVLVLIFSLRVNLSTFIALFAVFSGLSLLLAPLMASIGESLLLNEGWADMWTALYQSYWFRLAAYNNTLVLGSAVLSIVLLLPVFFIARWLVIKYRAALMAFVDKFKVVQSLKASKFYQIYQTVHSA